MQPRGNNAPADVAGVQTGLSVINTFAYLWILLGRNVGQLPTPYVDLVYTQYPYPCN